MGDNVLVRVRTHTHYHIFLREQCNLARALSDRCDCRKGNGKRPLASFPRKSNAESLVYAIQTQSCVRNQTDRTGDFERSGYSPEEWAERICKTCILSAFFERGETLACNSSVIFPSNAHSESETRIA